MEEKIINGKTYRLVTLRERSKWVSADGDLINPYRNQKVGIHYNPDGYPCTGGGVPVHLYVAYGWLDGYFEGAEVNHKDFDRNNYNVENLEWITHADNVKYSVNNNSEVWKSSKQGTRNGRATFTEDEVKIIRGMYDNGNSIADIVRVFYPELKTQNQYHNIHSTFANICKRKTWNCI